MNRGRIIRRVFTAKKPRRVNKSAPFPGGSTIIESMMLNNQQLACTTLIQESERNNFQQQQPDEFLRTTPKTSGRELKGKDNQINGYGSNTGSFLKKVNLQIEKNCKYEPNIQIYNQKEFANLRQNFMIKLNRQSQFPRNPISQPFVMGKEVLNLTQYIIAESHYNLDSYDHVKKQFQSQYLRVRKQMKGRQIKNKKEMLPNDQNKKSNSNQKQNCSSKQNIYNHQINFCCSKNNVHKNTIKFRPNRLKIKEQKQCIEIQKFNIRRYQTERSQRNRKLKNIKIYMHGYPVNMNPQQYLTQNICGNVEKCLSIRNRYSIQSN